MPNLELSLNLVMGIDDIFLSESESELLGQRKKDPCFSLARASIFQWQVKKIEAGVKIRVELFNY